MERRQFFGLIGGLAAWPMAAHAQHAVPVVGLLSGTHLDDREISAIRQGLKEGGYIEGRNIAIEYRSADGQYERLQSLAAEFAEHEVAVIVAVGGTVTALAAKAATKIIPIVFATAGDPVRLKLVSSLNQPGANITGVSFLGAGLGPKRYQLLHELIPGAKTVGYLVNPLNPNSKSETADVQNAVHALGQEFKVQSASNEHDIDVAFTNFAQEKIDGLIVAADAVFTRNRSQLVSLAAHNSVPAIYALPQFVTGGGLISYGASRLDAFRLVGVYAAKILKGEKAGRHPCPTGGQNRTCDQPENSQSAAYCRATRSTRDRRPSG